MDQALTLRRMAAVSKQGSTKPNQYLPKSSGPANRIKVLSFTSGKGGVGKSHIVVNLAYALQSLGLRVMVLDGDLGLANIDVLLGLAPHFNVHHVLAGEKSLSEVLVNGPAGMVLLPASSGMQDLVRLTEEQRLDILSEFDALQDRVDILLIDTAAGISSNVMHFNTAAHGIIVVVTPEPTSITDAYALIKLLATKHATKSFNIMTNSVANETEGTEAFRRLSIVTKRFLNISLDYLGCVVYDLSFSQAVRQQKPLLELFPSSVAAQCFHRLAERILDIPVGVHSNGNIQFFWRQLLTGLSHHPPDPSNQSVEAVL